MNPLILERERCIALLREYLERWDMDPDNVSQHATAIVVQQIEGVIERIENGQAPDK